MEDDIFFSEFITSKSNSFLLFDIPQELLFEVDGSALHINGEDREDAIICGKQTSYLIKKNETTNSLLIIEDNKILKVDHEIFIFEKTIPPLHQIYGLLAESPYTFKDQSN
jgi:RNase P/RNase MRP subunit p29